MNFIKKFFRKLHHYMFKSPITKADSELDFWEHFILDLISWYQGDLKILFGEPNPSAQEKVIAHSLADSAMLTWFNVHQKTKYLQDLMADKDYFSGMKVLDIGSGPYPSALAFENCEVYCLDPLLPDYIKIGFPIHYYDRAKFIYSHSENIPIDDGFFDAVISVNAIDHIDDLQKTSAEIKRVLKPNGKFRMHVHYHKKVLTEPIEINDEVMNNIFGWCKDFKKIGESKSKRGHTLVGADETYAVWSN